MTKILRLKGLDDSAQIKHVRRFFDGFDVPKGGVCILGGKCGEAFVALTSEKDAKLALALTGRPLKGSAVNLRMGSFTELEHKLKAFLRKKKNKTLEKRSRPLKQTVSESTPEPVVIQPVSPVVGSDPRLKNAKNALPDNLEPALCLGVDTVLQGQSATEDDSPQNLNPSEEFPQDVGSVSPHTDAVVGDVSTVVTQSPGYVRIFGVPSSTTKEELVRFFEGLHVDEVMMHVKLGSRTGCLVKFASELDEDNARLFSQKSLGSSCMEVRTASEKIWTKAIENPDVEEKTPVTSGPLRENLDYKLKATSAYKRTVLQQQASKKPRLELKIEHIVKVTNLSKDMTKSQIKELIGCPDLAYKQIILLLDKTAVRTDVAFIILNNEDDYNYAINLNGCHVHSGAIEVTPATRASISEAISKNYCVNPHRKSYPEKDVFPAWKRQNNSEEKLFLFIRNMPGDVQKQDIKTFFQDYNLKYSHIFLLRNSEGCGTGEAVVQFKSALQAAMAHKLHNRDFYGNKLLMTCINAKLRDDIIL